LQRYEHDLLNNLEEHMRILQNQRIMRAMKAVGAAARPLMVVLLGAGLAILFSSGRCVASATPSADTESPLQKTSQEILDGIGKSCQEIGQASCNSVFHALVEFQERRYEQAAADYESLIRLFPQSGELHYNLAECYYYLQRYDEAISAYKEAIRLRPRDGFALSNLGEVYWMLGQLDPAEATLTKAVDVMPELAVAHYCLGVVLKDKGRFEESSQEYRKAIAINPGFAYAHCNLGDVLSLQGKEKEATVEFLLAVMLDPKDALAQSGLATALRNMRDIEVAAKAVDSLGQEYPRFASGYYFLSHEFASREKYASADSALKRAIEIEPEFSAAHCDRGAVLHKLNRIPEAIREYREAIRLDPNDPIPYNNLISTFMDKRDLDSAIAVARLAKQARPEVADFRKALGELLAESGKTEEAATEFREAHRLEPESEPIKSELAAVLYNQGNMFKKQQRFEDAVSSYREAIDIQPEYLEAVFNLGNTLDRLGRSEEALGYWCKSLKMQPDLQRAVDNIGYYLTGKGMSKEQVTKFIDSVRVSK
jgi:tetratricopeptide (TPR) repeat protein